MGYTHYWYRKQKLERKSYDAFIKDLKSLLPVFNVLNIKLASGSGEGIPIIKWDDVSLNGSSQCGHDSKDLGIAWPSNNGSGLYDLSEKKAIEKGTMGDSKQLVVGGWFAGCELAARSCGGDCSHESFSFPLEENKAYSRFGEDGSIIFNFCKTAFKPYDLAVNCTLILAKLHFKDDILISSDGTIENWKDAIELIHRAFNYNFVFEFDKTEHLKRYEEHQREKDGFYTRNGWKGDKYDDTKDLGTVDVAKRIRKQLKTEFPDYKFSVTSKYFSMGSSISVALMEAPIKIIKPFSELSEYVLGKYSDNGLRSREQLKEMQESNYHQINDRFGDYDPETWNNGVFLTEQGHNILKCVAEIVNQYQRQDNDAMTDYFDNRFYFHLHVGKWNKKFLEGG